MGMHTDDGTGLGRSIMVFLDDLPHPGRLAGANTG